MLPFRQHLVQGCPSLFQLQYVWFETMWFQIKRAEIMPFPAVKQNGIEFNFQNSNNRKVWLKDNDKTQCLTRSCPSCLTRCQHQSLTEQSFKGRMTDGTPWTQGHFEKQLTVNRVGHCIYITVINEQNLSERQQRQTVLAALHHHLLAKYITFLL